MTQMISKRIRGGKFNGYGWPATLELLSPPPPTPAKTEFAIKGMPRAVFVSESRSSYFSRF